METWLVVLLAVLGCIIVAVAAFLIWLHRSAMSPGEAVTELRALGVDLVRLPGRLRRLAADLRTPRRAHWWLIGLAIYVVSPIDPIPDFISWRRWTKRRGARPEDLHLIARAESVRRMLRSEGRVPMPALRRHPGRAARGVQEMASG